MMSVLSPRCCRHLAFDFIQRSHLGDPLVKSRTALMYLGTVACGALLGWLTTSDRPEARAQDAPLANASGARSVNDPLDRTVLPIPEPKLTPITELDARKAKAPPRFEVKAPKGAPNVLIVLLDDMGFGMSGAFGGPIHMPTVERLAR